MVDSGAGKIGNFWQVGFLCNALLVPTSMSWTDLRPTLDFIKEMMSGRTINSQQRRISLWCRIVCHLNQRHF